MAMLCRDFAFFLWPCWKPKWKFPITSKIINQAERKKKQYRGQFNKTFTSVIYECSYCFSTSAHESFSLNFPFHEFFLYLPHPIMARPLRQYTLRSCSWDQASFQPQLAFVGLFAVAANIYCNRWSFRGGNLRHSLRAPRPTAGPRIFHNLSRSS